MTTEIPQVNIGRRHGEPLNVTQMLPLPADTPFGNLAAKFMMILERLDHVNGIVQQVFGTYEAAKATPLGRLSIMHHALLAEETVYWMRKTADEVIGLVAFLAEREAAGKWPTSLAPFPIADVLKKPPAWVRAHLSFLSLLNEVSNAYKHSFVNSDLNLIGRDEPGVYALALRNNNLEENEPRLHNIRFAELVTRFDSFFQAACDQLRACRLPHREPTT